MAQSIPIDAYLGAHRTGLSIGAALYQLDGSTSHAAFSTSGWYEAPASSGAWHHPGLSLPDAGGVIAVGVSGTEYMRVAVEARQLLYSEYTAPDNTTIGTINTKIGTPASSVSADIAGVQSDTDNIQSRLPAALVNGRMDSNTGAISGDATAADNAEAFFDGTGYAGTNNVIPIVTSVTNTVGANVTQISGDSVAADNLEAALDGTGGVTITAGLTGNVTGNLSGNVGGSVASVTAGVSLADGAITSAKFGAGAITASVIATNAIDADALAADAVAEIQNGLATAADLATVDTVVDAILVDTAEIGVAGAGLTALATQASVNVIDDFLDTEIAAIKAKTDNLPTSPANEATLTTIASYLDTEVAAILAAVDTEVAAIKTVTDALPNGGALTTITNNVAAILADTGTDGVVLANNALTAAALATDAVTEIQSGLATATALTALSDKVGTPVGVSVSADVAAIKAETASIQSDTNDIQTQIGAAGAGLTAVASAANLATLTAYVDTEVAAIKAKTDNLPTDPADASDVASSLATITSYIDTEVASILAAVDTEVAAIKTVTDALPDAGALTTISSSVASILADTGTDGVVVAVSSKSGYSLAADQSGVTVGTVNSLGATAQAQVNAQADTALADYDAPTKAELDAAQTTITNAIAALNDLSAAEVNAEVDTALLDVGLTTTITGRIDAAITSRSTLTAQQVWEYASRTLTGVGTLAADVWSYATRTLTSFGSISAPVAAASAGTVVVYAYDTWQFSISNSSLTLSGYEAVAFVVKSYDGHSDNDAILYVRSDSGLVRIGGVAGTAGDGSLTVDSATQITVNVALTATGVAPGTYTWWIKSISTSPSPTTGFTVATGRIIVYPAGLRAIA